MRISVKRGWRRGDAAAALVVLFRFFCREGVQGWGRAHRGWGVANGGEEGETSAESRRDRGSGVWRASKLTVVLWNFGEKRKHVH